MDTARSRGSNTLDHFFDWLDSHTNLEKIHPSNVRVRREYRIDRMRKLVARFDNPHQCYKIIHVAGSKGKSSTANMLAEILAATGQRVGCYLSPHVNDWRERIQIKPHQPTDRELLSIGETMRDRCFQYYGARSSAEHSSSAPQHFPTTFELLTLWALLCFRELKCDWVILECGLGGRLDATNIVAPVAAVICPIELEHTQYLGTTLTQIATEKAGIIKRARPIFVAYQHPKVMGVLHATANQQRAPLYAIGDYLQEHTQQRHAMYTKSHIQMHNPHGGTATFSYCTHRWMHQKESENAALAALSIITLLPTITLHTIVHALERAELPGRYEQLMQSPIVVVDGAHTLNSIQNIVDSFCTHFGKERTVLFGCRNDKAMQEMAAIIAPHFSQIYITPIPHAQSADPHLLRTYFIPHCTSHSDVHVIEHWRQIINKYLAPNTTLKPLLVCGSLYLVGAVRTAIQEKLSG